jgi:hypothetical protein
MAAITVTNPRTNAMRFIYAISFSERSALDRSCSYVSCKALLFKLYRLGHLI